MTNLQLYTLLFGPMIFNTLLIGLLKLYITSKVDTLSTNMTIQFHAVNQRFDDMKDLWRAELYRVEGVIDARLKHLEEMAK